MRKPYIWVILVIVLVCLNWFKVAVAKDLSALSDVDKAALMTRIGEPEFKQSEIESYRTPIIYDAVTEIGLPELDPADKEPQSAQLVSFDELSPFGMELFAGPREAMPPDDIAAASDYILGPGDNIIISLWGQAEQEYLLTVNREGKVFVPRLGELVCWGKSLEVFEKYAHKSFSTIYSDFSLSISLGKIRSIRIYMTGEVTRPGAYTVSSLTSLFNALYLSGGPTRNGSMRQIRLMRSGQQVGEVDLYKFLLEGDNSSDARLQSGDAIFIPVAGPRVAIRGKIRREAIYELKDNQTVRDLLVLAGGATADAYLDRVALERISEHDELIFQDLNLNPRRAENNDNIALVDGDRITVPSIFKKTRNHVAAYGMVKHPGRYERADSARVSDLIAWAKLQPYDVYYKRANLFRRHHDWRLEVLAINLEKVLSGSGEEDIFLQDGDSLHVYAIGDVAWSGQVHIEGEVRQPGGYPYYENMTVEDLIFLAGSYKPGASLLRAEVARVDKTGQVTLYDISLNSGEANNTFLQNNDRIYVRQIPQWQLHRAVTLEGEVQYPGEYILSNEGETLYDLILRSGGFAMHAFPQGTILERKSIEENLRRLNIPDLLKRSGPLTKDSLGNVTRDDFFDYQAASMNRIILDMDLLLTSKGEQGNVVLQPGDKIFVPAQPSGISILGAVGANGTITFETNQRVKHYVRRAGSFTAAADKNSLRLVKANGIVHSGGGIMGKTVEMGDIIMVPTKIKEKRKWGKTLTTFLTTTTGLLTTALLISRL